MPESGCLQQRYRVGLGQYREGERRPCPLGGERGPWIVRACVTVTTAGSEGEPEPSSLSPGAGSQ